MRPTDNARIGRRRLIAGAGGAAGALLLGGCDRLSDNPRVQNALDSVENVTRRVQRALSPRQVLAREYTQADLSPKFRANGTTDPDDDDYQALAEKNFVDWRLQVDGLVQRPLTLSLAELRAMPARTQITRHDCVEGWSCIGKWKGVPLAAVLQQAGVQPRARYAVFHCADPMENGAAESKYYESIDLHDAVHPQTILAYEMNDQVLPVAHGAPVRLRVERQLGYKMAKYVMRIELVDGFAELRGGKGGYWEDLGYAWYAGI
ncbi:MAG: molybdopterin-binding protein [Alphaproteobacteria bacterium]|nr:molybdopterin-binding protein [Alphaproteobacteria bacterium]